MSLFEDNLKTLPTVEKIVLARLRNSKGDLLAVIPNLSGKAGTLRVFSHIADSQGRINHEAAAEGLRLFGEYVGQAKKSQGKHPKLDLLLSLSAHEKLVLEKIETSVSNLLESISLHKASADECDVFIELLNHGQVRAAEKIQGIWVPQIYVIDGVLNYFGTHKNVRMGSEYWDKIPLKTANYTDQMFEQGGVRYAPGSKVRTGAYIGPRTVVMNLAFVNIGAYIAGEGVMIDGGARVGSCAQMGRGIKLGGGSGIEGILEPAGRLASIVEDNVKIGAMCEIAGIVGEGSIVASGVVMASGKKIIDQDTGEQVPPLKCVVGQETFLLPVIPPYRLAVGGSIITEDSEYATDAVLLKPGDLRDTSTIKHFKKQGILYS